MASLELLNLVLDGFEVEAYICIEEEDVQLVRAALQWSAGRLYLPRLSVVGLCSKEVSVAVYASAGLSGDQLLRSLPLQPVLEQSSSGHVERDFEPAGRKITFDYELLELDAAMQGADVSTL